MQNILKTSIVALALIFSTGSLAMAQQLQSDGTISQPQQAAPAQQPTPDQAPMHRHAPNPAHETRRLTRQLGLTPDQAAKLQPVLADRDARIAALHSDTTLDPKTMHRQGHAIARDTQGKIDALLTPAQQQTYADLRAAHHHHGGQDAAPTPNV